MFLNVNFPRGKNSIKTNKLAREPTVLGNRSYHHPVKHQIKKTCQGEETGVMGTFWLNNKDRDVLVSVSSVIRERFLEAEMVFLNIKERAEELLRCGM